MFSGAITALITPFNKGKVDERAFQNLVQWQIEEGIHGLVPCGTTGESPTLSHKEHNRVVELCVEAAAGRVPVIAGAGSNSTDEAIMMATHARDCKADAVLVVTPYYNKPSQEGMYQHFKAIHDAVDMPIILYNVPGRSVVDLNDATTARLAKLPNIVGIKDATGNITRVSALRELLGDNPFDLISGDDETALGFNAQGGVGCISVTSNIAPKAVAEVQNLWAQGDAKGAMDAHQALIPLHQIMFCESNPVPVKYAASLMGLCKAEIRLPLILPSDVNRARIEHALKDCKLL